MRLNLSLKVFFISNLFLIFFLFMHWNVNTPLEFNGLASGSVLIIIFLLGSVGFFIGGYLASRSLYEKNIYKFMGLLFSLVFLVIMFGVEITQSIGNKGNHVGLVLVYTIISSIWLLIQITKPNSPKARLRTHDSR